MNEITEVTTKPIIFDGDNGGRIEHIPYLVKSLEKAGVSALVIEDKIGLKFIVQKAKKYKTITIKNFFVRRSKSVKV